MRETVLPYCFRLFLVFIGGCACLISGGVATAAESGDELLTRENLGGIRIGLGEKQLAAILGKAKVKKDKPVHEAATGDYIQTWTCAEKGLSLRLSSGDKPTGAKTVVGFTATRKCPFATVKGIKIGSTKADVLNAYGSLEDKENKSLAKPETFVAGSVFGGIIFTFNKDGKVSEIFFGAAAE